MSGIKKSAIRQWLLAVIYLWLEGVAWLVASRLGNATTNEASLGHGVSRFTHQGHASKAPCRRGSPGRSGSGRSRNRMRGSVIGRLGASSVSPRPGSSGLPALLVEGRTFRTERRQCAALFKFSGRRLVIAAAPVT